MKHVAHTLFNARDFAGRMRLIRLLLGPFRSIRSVYGPKMRVQARDYTNLAALFGAYGTELRDLILQLPHDGIFIDIGANAGIYTLIASAHLERGSVLSFEPNPRVFVNLLQNLELNECHNVLALNAAVGEPGSILELVMIETHSGAGHLIDAPVHGQSTVPVACLSFCNQPFVSDMVTRREVLCKIDVEGAERTVIRTLSESGLLDSINRLYVEICTQHLQRFGTKAEEIYDDLETQGFRPLKGRQLATSYDELFERA